MLRPLSKTKRAMSATMPGTSAQERRSTIWRVMAGKPRGLLPPAPPPPRGPWRGAGRRVFRGPLPARPTGSCVRCSRGGEPRPKRREVDRGSRRGGTGERAARQVGLAQVVQDGEGAREVLVGRVGGDRDQGRAAGGKAGEETVAGVL